MIFNEFTKVFLIGADEGRNESTRARKALLIMGVRPDNIFGGYCDDILLEEDNARASYEKKKRLNQLTQCDVAVAYFSTTSDVARRELEAAKIFGVRIIDMTDLKNELADYIIERYDKI